MNQVFRSNSSPNGKERYRERALVLSVVIIIGKLGNHTATWDASGMASGVYYYRLSAGSYMQTRAMVLMR